MRGQFGIRELTFKGGQIYCKGDLLDEKTNNPINDVARPIYLLPIPVVDRVKFKVEQAIEAAKSEAEGRPLDEVEVEHVRAPIVAEDKLYVALMKFMEALNEELETGSKMVSEG